MASKGQLQQAKRTLVAAFRELLLARQLVAQGNISNSNVFSAEVSTADSPVDADRTPIITPADTLEACKNCSTFDEVKLVMLPVLSALLVELQRTAG